MHPGASGSGLEALLASELRRSRRYKCRFAVLRLVAAEVGDHDLQGRKTHPTQERLRLSTAIERRIRCTDHLCRSSDGAVYAILPEADRAATERLVVRLRGELSELGAEIHMSVVIFPDDGLTIAGLLARVEGEDSLDSHDLTRDLRNAALHGSRQRSEGHL